MSSALVLALAATELLGENYSRPYSGVGRHPDPAMREGAANLLESLRTLAAQYPAR